MAFAEVGDTIETDSADADARAAQADIEAASACLRRGDFEEARRIADRAISTADLAGARPELARALALAASVPLRVGNRDHALALATKAMRMAQLDEHSTLLAEVKLGLADVQIRMGSGHAALDNLLAVHRTLRDKGPSLDLWRRERVLCDAYREIDRPADARHWCELALAPALRLKPDSRGVRERTAKVGILQIMMDDAQANEQPDEARAHGLQTLELLDTIEADAWALGQRTFRW